MENLAYIQSLEIGLTVTAGVMVAFILITVAMGMKISLLQSKVRRLRSCLNYKDDDHE